MTDDIWTAEEPARFRARSGTTRAGQHRVSACQLLISQGWRNGYMLGLLAARPLGLGNRLVGRARTCRYLMRRGPEGGARSRRPARLARDRR